VGVIGYERFVIESEPNLGHGMKLEELLVYITGHQ
jgi:hypothetical protein